MRSVDFVAKTGTQKACRESACTQAYERKRIKLRGCHMCDSPVFVYKGVTDGKYCAAADGGIEEYGDYAGNVDTF